MMTWATTSGSTPFSIACYPQVADRYRLLPHGASFGEGYGPIVVASEPLGRFEPVAQGRAADHIYIIDPMGNLMMRFPAKPDPSRMKKDLSKLLRASRIG